MQHAHFELRNACHLIIPERRPESAMFQLSILAGGRGASSTARPTGWAECEGTSGSVRGDACPGPGLICRSGGAAMAIIRRILHDGQGGRRLTSRSSVRTADPCGSARRPQPYLRSGGSLLRWIDQAAIYAIIHKRPAAWVAPSEL